MPGEAELAAGGQISGDMAAEIQCGITAQAVPSRRGAPGAGILLLTWSSKRLSTVIKRLREEKGLTPEELATRAGVTRPYVSMIESGERKSPSLPVLKRLAKALGVPVTALLE
jgi:XRE family transcriptional regulator of biofilm formation